MTAARTGRKQPSIRTLWAIAKSPELHLTDEDLHAVVYRETGKESMKMLTQGEVNTVARVLQNMKDSVSRSVRDKRTDTGGDIRTTAQRRKIYALCEALGWNDDPRRIQGFVKRVAHVDRIISTHAPLAGRDSKSVQITMHIFAITDKFQMLLHRMPPVRAFCSFLMQENHADFGCEPPK